MVLAIGFLLLVSLLVSAGVTALADTSRLVLGEGLLLVIGFNMLSSLVVTTLLFALIFKVLPDADVPGPASGRPTARPARSSS